MTTVVIMPGGFHPFHAGHLALYQSAQRAFPDAEIFVAATNDTSARPFPFAVKEKLAQLAGVDAGHFVQVKSPFRAEEITKNFNPEKDHLIFVRSEKDADKPPQAGGVKKNGDPAYLQPLLGVKKLDPFSKHAYMAYLPTVEFGPGMTSATEIRSQWPTLDEQDKMDMINSLYPKTQGNERLTRATAKLLDTAIVAESVNPVTANTAGTGAGMTSTMSRRYNQPAMEATLVNDPEQGMLIRPAGGLGTWSEQSLISSLGRQLQELVAMLTNGNYQGVEYALYRSGAMQAKVQALAALQRFKQKQGRRPIARGREIEVDEDYVEEKWSEKYKRSINCANPRGFSQRAHCAGRKKTSEDATGDLQKDLRNPHSYDAIDHVMTGIAEKHSITPDQLHDLFVEKHGCTPDDWIQKQKKDKLDEKCWDTHRQAGMKKKGNRMVPNCVPRESK